MDMIKREEDRNLFRKKCEEVCLAHGYPPKDIKYERVESIGMNFMILDKLDELLKGKPTS